MIALATKHPNVYVDTSAYAATATRPNWPPYLRAHGRRKVCPAPTTR
jgi:predicted TIM-barrel fold metal-dependent hydrolase